MRADVVEEASVELVDPKFKAVVRLAEDFVCGWVEVAFSCNKGVAIFRNTFFCPLKLTLLSFCVARSSEEGIPLFSRYNNMEAAIYSSRLQSLPGRAPGWK